MLYDVREGDGSVDRPRTPAKLLAWNTAGAAACARDPLCTTTVSRGLRTSVRRSTAPVAADTTGTVAVGAGSGTGTTAGVLRRGDGGNRLGNRAASASAPFKSLMTSMYLVGRVHKWRYPLSDVAWSRRAYSTRGRKREVTGRGGGGAKAGWSATHIGAVQQLSCGRGKPVHINGWVARSGGRSAPATSSHGWAPIPTPPPTPHRGRTLTRQLDPPTLVQGEQWANQRTGTGSGPHGCSWRLKLSGDRAHAWGTFRVVMVAVGGRKTGTCSA